MHTLLSQVFAVMNVADDQRGPEADHIRAFPYVNGGLFADAT
jgi:hypothetical protein